MVCCGLLQYGVLSFLYPSRWCVLRYNRVHCNRTSYSTKLPAYAVHCTCLPWFTIALVVHQGGRNWVTNELGLVNNQYRGYKADFFRWLWRLLIYPHLAVLKINMEWRVNSVAYDRNMHWDQFSVRAIKWLWSGCIQMHPFKNQQKEMILSQCTLCVFGIKVSTWL